MDQEMSIWARFNQYLERDRKLAQQKFEAQQSSAKQLVDPSAKIPKKGGQVKVK